MIRFQRRFLVEKAAKTSTSLDEKDQQEQAEADGSGLGEARRTLASLALERRRQNGVLGVRQSEVLRRAVTSVGTALDWDLLPGTSADRLAAAKRDVATMAKGGVDLLVRDLTAAMDRKKTEITSLKKVIATVRGLAPDAYPTEVTVAFTARSGLGGLVTRTEAFTLDNSADGLRVAEELEKKESDRVRLRDEMVEQLKERQRELRDMVKEISGFVESTGQVVEDVLAMPS